MQVRSVKQSLFTVIELLNPLISLWKNKEVTNSIIFVNGLKSLIVSLLVLHLHKSYKLFKLVRVNNTSALSQVMVSMIPQPSSKLILVFL